MYYNILVDVCSKGRLFKIGTTITPPYKVHTAFLQNNELNFPLGLFHAIATKQARISTNTMTLSR